MPRLSRDTYLTLSRGDGTPVGQIRLWQASSNEEGFTTYQGWSDHGPRFRDMVGSRVIATVGEEGAVPETFHALVVDVIEKSPGVAGPRCDVVLAYKGPHHSIGVQGPFAGFDWDYAGPRRSAVMPDPIPVTITKKESTMERELTKTKFKNALEQRQAELEAEEDDYIRAVSDALASDEAIDAWMEDPHRLVSVVTEQTKHASDGNMGRRRKAQLEAIAETLRWLDLVAGGTVTLSEDRINKLLK